MGERQRFTLDELEVGACYQAEGRHVRILGIVREQAPSWQKQASRALLNCRDLLTGAEIRLTARSFRFALDPSRYQPGTEQVGSEARLTVRDILVTLGVDRTHLAVGIVEGKVLVTSLLDQEDVIRLANHANGVGE